MEEKIIHKDLSYRVIGACFEVYNGEGQGFLEGVYQECLEIELTEQSIAFEAQKPLKIYYKGHELKQTYIPDFIIEEKIILEIKAVKTIADEHRAQVLNYLKASGYRLGILVNFGHTGSLQSERIVN